MARKTPQEQREKLLKQKQQLENRLKALDAKQTLQERKDDTRRKILVGAIVLHHATLKPDFKKWLSSSLSDLSRKSLILLSSAILQTSRKSTC